MNVTKKGLITGRLMTHRDGYGFVTPVEGGTDIFIPARALRDNLNGDLVEVAVEPSSFGDRREGRIVRTVERGVKRVIGRYEAQKGIGRVVSSDLRITHDIAIPQNQSGKAKSGETVVAEIDSYPSDRRPAMGRVVEVLGRPDDPKVEVLTVIRKYDLPDEFSPKALSEARSVAQITEADYLNRKDLRGLKIVTIDGETARDFDDAVAVKREADNKIRLWVSIADVSHYVKENSALDKEAYIRGTSVYFPDRCIPMLPEELSNGICSLNPNEDRLTLTAEMLFDASGSRCEATFYRSVIRSAARLTYTQVAAVIEKREPAAVKVLNWFLDDLIIMEELANRLTALRRKRGSLDFDLPEPEIIIDITSGNTVAIARSERNIAHRLIEEFMLAANEAVACYIESRDLPFLYRIHEPPLPDKIEAFAELAAGFGRHLNAPEGKADILDLQKLLESASGRPEELMLNRVLLRSMRQSRYSPDNPGHFCLAAKTYTHFTSPIRRYPDLIVHRILKSVLAGRLDEAGKERLAASLPEAGTHTSKRERIAMEAERELVELKRLQFMMERVGEEFNGFIIGATAYGLYVELYDFFVEGMIDVASLKDDYYLFVEKQHALIGTSTRRMFRIGDQVRVLTASVNLEQRRVEFRLIAHTPLQKTDAGWDIELPKVRKPTGKKVQEKGRGTERRQTASKGDGGGKVSKAGRGGRKGGGRRGRGY